MPLYIKSPITGEQIQVAENDFPDKMSWHEAMSACAGLGGGWRLPIKEEQRAMCEQLHEHGNGNFKDDWYWSGSEKYEDGSDKPESEKYENDAWYFQFERGRAHAYINYKEFMMYVRAVRSTLPNHSAI